MAKKQKLSPSKLRLKKQYDYQVSRIKNAYKEISYAGYKFPKTVEEIYKPVKLSSLQEATISRLKNITKNDLYRMAKNTEGQSAWKLRTEKIKRSAQKSLYTRSLKYEYKKSDGRINGFYYSDFSKWRKEKEKQLRDEYEWRKSHPSIYEPIEIEERERKQNQYTQTDLNWSEEVADDNQRYEKILNTITDIFEESEDSQMMQSVKREFEKMKEQSTKEKFNKWIDENQEKFIKTIKDIEKYKPKASPQGTGMQKYVQAMNIINEGIIPNDSLQIDDREYDESEYPDETEDEDEDDGSILVMDTTTGEVFKVYPETYLQRKDRWGGEHWVTDYFDENGFKIDIEKITYKDKHGNTIYEDGKPKQGYRDHYIPVSEIKENEDYM